MNIYLINESESAIEVNGASQSVALSPNERLMFCVRERGMLSIDGHILLATTHDGYVEVTDPRIQVSGIGGEFLKTYSVPESADFAFSILPPGEGDGDTPLDDDEGRLSPSESAGKISLLIPLRKPE